MKKYNWNAGKDYGWFKTEVLPDQKAVKIEFLKEGKIPSKLNSKKNIKDVVTQPNIKKVIFDLEGINDEYTIKVDEVIAAITYAMTFSESNMYLNNPHVKIIKKLEEYHLPHEEDGVYLTESIEDAVNHCP